MWRKKNRFKKKFNVLHPPKDVTSLTNIKKQTLEKANVTIKEQLAKIPRIPETPVICQMTNLENMYYFNQDFFSYDPYGCKLGKMNHKYFCQECLCPVKCCANKVFGDDLLYFFKKSSSEFGVYDYGIDIFNEPIKNSPDDVYERVKGYFNKLYSNLVFAKAINNGIDFNEHLGEFEVHQIEIPQCIAKGAFMDYLAWKTSELYMFNIQQGASVDYDPDEFFIKYFVDNQKDE